MEKILIVGSGAREHAIAQAFKRSTGEIELYNIGPWENPGLADLVKDSEVADITKHTAVIRFAKKIKATLIFVGPSESLYAGLVDKLEAARFKVFGPNLKNLNLAASRVTAMTQLTRSKVPGLPKHRVFDKEVGLLKFCNDLGIEGGFVVKPDSSKTGPVKVQGLDFHEVAEGVEYAEKLLKKGKVVIEQKLEGQEFTLMTFVDGKHFFHMPLCMPSVRSEVGDEGDITIGMGSISMANHSISLLQNDEVNQSHNMCEKIVRSMFNADKGGHGYKGILTLTLMASNTGVKLIGIQPTFGDPEAMNVLPLLQTDLDVVCKAVMRGNLDKIPLKFTNRATVVRYIVPQGYPTDINGEGKLDLKGIDQHEVHVFLGNVEKCRGGLNLLGGPAAAVVGYAQTLTGSTKRLTEQITKIKGPVKYREDIGTALYMVDRISMLKRVRSS